MTVAAATGRPLSEIRAIPASDLALWRAWMRAHPPDGTQMLLASLCALTANVHRSKDQPPLGALDFAPWLASREQRAEKQAAAEKRRYEELVAQSEAVAHVYRQERKRGESGNGA